MVSTAESGDLTAARRLWILKDLPPYRPVARKLMTLTSAPEVPLARIQEVLRTDAAFSADVFAAEFLGWQGLRVVPQEGTPERMTAAAPMLSAAL